MVRVGAGSGALLNHYHLTKRSHYLSITYVALAALFLASLPLGRALEISSGITFSIETRGYDFRSIYFLIGSDVLPPLVLALLSLAGSVCGWYVKTIADGKTTPQWLEQYLSTCYLADVGGDFHPDYTKHRNNFNTGAIAPVVKFADRTAKLLERNYRHNEAESIKSRDVLLEAWMNCQHALRNLLQVREDEHHVRIRLFHSTSRALEVVIRELATDNDIVVLPYEHPSEKCVAEWVARTSNNTVRSLSYPHDFFTQPWENQCGQVVEAILDGISETGRRPVIVASEVAYGTGLVIPVSDLRQKLLRACEQRQITKEKYPAWIIDAAHAVGNIVVQRSWVATDAYVFSAHKWLMSPYVAGIAVGPAERPGNCYDDLDNALPKGRVSEHAIFGLSAALKMADVLRIEDRWARSQELVRRLLGQLGTKFDTVGSGTGLMRSCMVTLRPGPGFQWRYRFRDQLADYFTRTNMNVEVISYDPACPWVRVSVPYFLDVVDVMRLAKALQLVVKGEK
jgi:hypothetical protein